MKNELLLDGVELPVLGLGAWRMGGGMTADYSRDDETVAVIQSAIAMGYTHIDTAEVYGAGHSEELIGRAIRELPREGLFLTSKVAKGHLAYADVHRAIDGSLARLGVDYLDLYLIHWPNPDVPLSETFRALNEIVAAGKVRRIGVSNFDVPLMRQSIDLCNTPIFNNQVHYNLLHRWPEENGVLELCQAQGILLTAYSPLKDGVLAHPEAQAVAANYGVTSAHIAINWLVRQPQVITIPMSMNLAHLQDNIDALDLDLNAEDVARLDRMG